MYFATDVATMYVYVVSAWFELSPGAGSVPIGGLLNYAGASDPTDTRYALCDGRALSRSTYAALFNVIGTAYGAGDGSSTFNVPDIRGRSVVGAGNGPSLTPRNRGDKGGEEAHAISVNELPSHGHTLTDPGHAHSLYDPGHSHSMGAAGNHSHGGLTGFMDRNNPHGHQEYFSANGGQSSVQAHVSGTANYDSGGYGATDRTGNTDINHAHAITADGSHSHTVNGAATGMGVYGSSTGITIANTGSGSAANNMQPFLVASMIIRIS